MLLRSGVVVFKAVQNRTEKPAADCGAGNRRRTPLLPIVQALEGMVCQ
jgi:hypothetical protein